MWQEKRQISRDMSKNFLKFLKRDSLKQLVDLGVLRSHREYSFGVDFLPQLMNQAEAELREEAEQVDELDQMLLSGIKAKAVDHKQAIFVEMLRRKEAKNEKERIEKEAAAAKKNRKEKRQAMREVARIQGLQETILANIVAHADQVEFTPALPIYDIREYSTEQAPGVFVIGGLVGEIIVTLSALYDYALANPNNSNFRLTDEGVEKYLTELLADFREGSISLDLKENLSSSKFQGGDDNLADQAVSISNKLKEAEMHNSYGLKFLLANRRDVLINEDAVREVFAAIARIHFREPDRLYTVPDEEAEGEEKENNTSADVSKDTIVAKNEEIEKNN